MYSVPDKQAKKQPGGRPLAERVAEALLSEQYAFCFEFSADNGEDVFGVYKVDDGGGIAWQAEPVYAIEVVGGQIVRCNCPDAQCRRRICKHQVCLSLVTGYGITAPGLPSVTHLYAPTPVSQALDAQMWRAA